MSVIVLVFALNLFGVFEISPATKWLTRGVAGWTGVMAMPAHFFKEFSRLSWRRPAPRRFSEPRLASPSLNQPLVILAMFARHRGSE